MTTQSEPAIQRTIDTPVGPLSLAVLGGAVVEISFGGRPQRPTRPGDDPLLDRLEAQLREYFRGERTEFDLPVAPEGTEFQRRVWSALQEIPFGETVSYGELAARTGNPKASRAVGLANGRNPIPILIPCHRVIGANRRLTGFGGGLDTKAKLLSLESAEYLP